ncbi:MAG: MFS transporter [Brevibacterium aurantiacum]|uniref:MFS transporter n=1 Tax=Brevibacterium aurantiacum TaxID=273384 RepID=A0A1D7W513_BREAU|nr:MULTISPECIES: MFS transporter [Brevibacterium]MDN5593852.1 MFS transporter [Brevibacterium sp.]AOP54072.1 Membrane protein mosC [Brevibacterium aurantiacum]AZT97665.1 MFS transporter [Brevibacterium aurantiacum]MDN5608214.1 MFS transporter [Brevibacterium sp.]MDN5711936.1 MFS transporter [Brevibacterium aurantiacum]
MSPRPSAGARAITGVGLYFSCNGFVFAALLPWYPLLVQRLGLSSWEFGLVVASFALGAIVSSVVPAHLISRFGANAVVVGGTVLLGLSAATTAWSVNGWMMAICLFLVGFFDAIVDVAQNVVGIGVQESLSRVILSSMHALWSLGGLVSGALATIAAANGMDMRLHLALITVASIIVILLARRLIGDAVLRSSSATSSIDDIAEVDAGPSAEAGSSEGAGAKQPSSRRAILLMALPLAVVAICGTAVEDIANNWSALAAVEFSGMSAATAGIAFSVVIGSQCLGRFSGDILVQRFGSGRIARLGGGLIALGGLGAVTAFEPIQLLVGLGMMGYGSATLVPGALGAAAHLPGVGRAGGVTLVNWIMRIGFLGTSPLVGVIAGLGNLRWGLSVLIVIGAVTMVFAGRLGGRPLRSD